MNLKLRRRFVIGRRDFGQGNSPMWNFILFWLKYTSVHYLLQKKKKVFTVYLIFNVF